MNQILPHFNEDENHFVLMCLSKTTMKYRDIALAFRQVYPEFAPEVPDSLFIEKFTRRCRNKVTDRRSKEAKIIAEGRKGQRDSGDHVLLSMKKYRMEERQRLFDQLGELGEKAGETTDRDRLNSLKNALTAVKAQLAEIHAYERGLRDQEKIDNSGRGGGIVLPELEDR